MNTISGFLAPDHHRCDDLFADAEDAVSRGDWKVAEERLAGFLREMGHHFAMEEQVLFPAFEERTGMMAGPTQVMRMEHAQMREIFGEMAQAVQRRDVNAYAGLSETLLILMQQHNLKEEQMLYPMSDQALGAGCAEVIERMRAVAEE